MSQREIHLVKESCQELFEDHLGAAPIKPGDSVIIRNKWHVQEMKITCN